MSTNFCNLYRWCIVPDCTNNSVKTPQKLWIQVPNDINMRNTWLELAKRDPKQLSTNTTLYLCEDHFDLPNDMENYIKYRVMGSVAQIRMKPGCVPTKFECQLKRKNTTHKPNILKKKRKVINQESEVHSEEYQHLLPIDIENSELDDVSSRDLEIKLEADVDPMDASMDDPLMFEDIKVKVEEHPVVDPDDFRSAVEFVAATSDNLPKVNMFAIVELFAMKPSYRSLDYAKIKQETGDNTGDDCIGCVQVHKQETKYTIQGTVAFNTTESHTCVVKYEEREKIIEYTSCDCQNSACEHVIAFVMWLHRRTEELTHTSIYYNLSPKIQQTQFITLKQLCDNNTDSETQPVPDNDQDVLKQFLAVCKDKSITSPLVSYFIDENPATKTSIHQIICQAEEMNIKDADEFIEYCRVNVSCLDYAEAARVTSHNKQVQQELEYGRIAHDLIYDVTEANNEDNIELLLDKILMPDVREKDNLNDQIIDIAQRKLKLEIIKCGLLLSENYPIFCGLPYGVTKTHVVDVAYAKGDETIEDYVEDHNLTDKTKARLTLLMLLAKKQKAYFVLLLDNEQCEALEHIEIHECSFNRKYCNQMITKCTEFWKKNVFQGKLLINL